MADSRRASQQLMSSMQRIVESQTRIINFLLCIIGALLITYLMHETSFTAAQDYVLFLLFFSIGLWVTEAIPPFAVGILIVGFLVFFLGNPNVNPAGTANSIDVQGFVNTWSNSVIWLILGGFFLAEGMKKTGLDMDVFKFSVMRFGTKPHMVLLGIMLATAVASMVISNTATTAMMLAATAPLLSQINENSPFSKAVILGIPAAASIGGMGTIIGSPPNAIAVDALNNIKRIDFEIGFLEWMLFGVPVAILLVLIVWYILVKKYKPRLENFNLEVLKNGTKEVGEYELREHKIRKKIVLGILLLTIFLWLTSKLHPIPAAAVSGLPIIVFTMVGIITSTDVRKLPWDTLMLVAGGLSLGLAIEQTGLAQHFVEKIQEFHLSSFWLIITFALATVIFSNIMSNTATATILIPMASLFIGINPIVLPLVIGLCASCALFLPVSTPPNAIAFSTGKIKQVEFRLGGTVAGLAGPVIIILWVLMLAGLMA